MQDRFDVGVKTLDITIQLVLQQCLRRVACFFVARVTVPSFELCLPLPF